MAKRAQMWLNKLGKRGDQNFVFDQSGLDPTLGRGCYTVDLVRALTAIGFNVGPVWQTVRPADRQRELDAAFHALYADLKAGVPSIVCMHYDDRPNTTEHFRLVLGYDAASDEVIYNEPAEAHGAYRRMGRALFLKLWPLGSADSLFLVRIRLEGNPEKLFDALRRRLAASGRKRRPNSHNISCGLSDRFQATGISRLSCSRRSSSSATNRRKW